MKIKKLSRLNFQNLGVRNFLSGSVFTDFCSRIESVLIVGTGIKTYRVRSRQCL
jgi:hypothetical protein